MLFVVFADYDDRVESDSHIVFSTWDLHLSPQHLLSILILLINRLSNNLLIFLSLKNNFLSHISPVILLATQDHSIKMQDFINYLKEAQVNLSGSDLHLMLNDMPDKYLDLKHKKVNWLAVLFRYTNKNNKLFETPK